MHTRAGIGLDALLTAGRELEGQGQSPDIQQGQSSSTTQACPGCKNFCACACQPCGQCKKITKPSNMRLVDGILHCRKCESKCKSTTPSRNAHTPTTSPIQTEFVMFRTLNFDGDTIMQNQDAGDNQITRLRWRHYGLRFPRLSFLASPEVQFPFECSSLHIPRTAHANISVAGGPRYPNCPCRLWYHVRQ